MPRTGTYTPKNKLRIGYTSGDEFVTAVGRNNYVGFYHRYPTGSIYSEREYDETRSIELIEISVSHIANINNITYYNLTDTSFNKYIKPKYQLPRPTAENYRVGIIIRYVVQKINEPENIIEISEEQARTININNRIGIDGNLYRFYKLQWSITGPREEIITANLRVLNTAELLIPGITKYFSDLTEFVK